MVNYCADIITLILAVTRYGNPNIKSMWPYPRFHTGTYHVPMIPKDSVNCSCYLRSSTWFCSWWLLTLGNSEFLGQGGNLSIPEGLYGRSSIKKGEHQRRQNPLHSFQELFFTSKINKTYFSCLTFSPTGLRSWKEMYIMLPFQRLFSPIPSIPYQFL